MSIKRIIKLEDISNVIIKDNVAQLEMKICLYDYKYINGEYNLNVDVLFRYENMFNHCYIANTAGELIEITESYQTRHNNPRDISGIDAYFVKDLPSIYDKMVFRVKYIHGKNMVNYKDNRITVYIVILDNNQTFFIFRVEDIAVTRKDKLLKLKKRIANKKTQVE